MPDKTPPRALGKSITIRGAQGFGLEKAVLFTTGNWNIANGATIDHIRFVDVEVRGEDIGGDYVFNPNNDSQTTINELTFDDCILSYFRGITDEEAARIDELVPPGTSAL